ncbi:MAG: cbb3-type cytochrome oxidase assembly protein [Bdellovibrionales bacterium]|nr:cbb3-type cytochrome oxidase assembly protein [Bdellovibrionales bacterium]
MNILILLIFVSIVLVVGAVVLFLHSVKNQDFDHIEELSLLPLEEDQHADKKPNRNL